MATVVELAKDGHLYKMKGNLRSHEVPERTMYASKEVITWFKETLKYAVSDQVIEGSLTPVQQAMSITHAFVSGDSLEEELEPHIMEPKDEGIWVIRTPDLRLYGWFWKPRIFILVSADIKANLEENKELYDEHVQTCCEFRKNLDLDEPKTEFGDLNHVAGI